MARSEPIVPAFGGGEISPHLDARSDWAPYAISCRLLQNFIVRPQGGAWRRGGTRFVAAVEDAAERTCLTPFEYSVEQAYMLEQGDRYFRFFKDKAQIVVAATGSAISNGAFTSNITGWDDLSTGGGSISHDATNGRLNLIPSGTAADDIGWAEQDVTVAAGDQAKEHVLTFRVVGAAADRVQVRIGTASGGSQILADRVCRTGWHAVAFTPGASPVYIQFRNQGSANNDFLVLSKTIQIDDVALLDDAPLEIGAPWAQADLFDDDNLPLVWHTQSNDVLYLTHPTTATHKLSRSGHSTWALEAFAFENGPYAADIVSGATLTPGAATGAGVTMTASAVTNINGGQGFLATDVGRLIAGLEGSTWGWAVIVGWTSSTVVTVDVRSTFTNTNAKSTWRLGLYSDTTGWPHTSTFWGERFKTAGAADAASRWDGTATGDFENFTPGTGDADAVAFTIASDGADAIRWMAPAKKLLLGTALTMGNVPPIMPGQGIYAASGSTAGEITPTDIEVRAQTRDTVLAWDRFRRELLEIGFTFEADGYVAQAMTVRSEHMTRGGILGHAWQRKPFGILWAYRADGLLLGFTYLRDQEVTAWTRHPIGGDGIVEAVASIPGAAEDEVWLIVRRTIDGNTVRYVEILEPPLSDEQPDQIEAFYVDSGLTYDGAVAATLTPGAGATTKGQTGVTFTAGSSVFVSGDVGREIRYRVAADPDANPPVEAVEARAKITGYASGTEIAATIQGAFPSTAAIASGAWRMSVTSLSGADHLEGETVQILTDGAVHPPKVVTGGAIALDYPATYVHAGLQYKSRLKPTKFDPGTPAGTAQGKTRRVAEATVRLHRSLGFGIGPTFDNLDRPPFRAMTGTMALAVPLRTGDKKQPFRGTHDTFGDICLEQDQPLPLNVLAIMPTLDLSPGG